LAKLDVDSACTEVELKMGDATVTTNEATFSGDWYAKMKAFFPKSIGQQYQEEVQEGKIESPTRDTSYYSRLIRASKVFSDWNQGRSKEDQEAPPSAGQICDLMAKFASIEVKLTLRHDDDERAANMAPDPMEMFLQRLDAMASTKEQQQRLFRDDEI